MSKVLDCKQMNQLGQYLDFLSFFSCFFVLKSHHLGNFFSTASLSPAVFSNSVLAALRHEQAFTRTLNEWQRLAGRDGGETGTVNAILISLLTRLMTSPDWREWKSISSLSLCFSFLHCFYFLILDDCVFSLVWFVRCFPSFLQIYLPQW